MTRRNRVTPFGAIEAAPERGTLMGNRGILHDGEGRLGQARWRHKAWISCALEYKGGRLPLAGPGHYTVLFFCDEAVAMAAGHRPCALCRRVDFLRFRHAWTAAAGSEPSAPEMDRALHDARIAGRDQRRVVRGLDTLPDHAFVERPGEPGEAWLVRGPLLHRWSHGGYRERRERPSGARVNTLTPEPMLAVLAAGYVPALHPSFAGPAEP